MLNVKKCIKLFNSLPGDKILALSKFAHDHFNVTQNIKLVFCKVEKIPGNRKNCWLPAFSPFPTMFSKGCSLKGIKSGHCVVMGLLHV